MEIEWRDIGDIEEFREHYEFSSYAVLIGDVDEDGDHGDWNDLAFGIEGIPKQTKRFCLIPEDQGA